MVFLEFQSKLTKFWGYSSPMSSMGGGGMWIFSGIAQYVMHCLDLETILLLSLTAASRYY